MANSPKPGEGVDAQGKPAVDPTKNVLDLVDAAIRRVDDLRQAQESVWEAKYQGLRREIDTAERLRIEQKADTRTAVDAALAAAKEAVTSQAASSKEAINKSEVTSAEQARQQTATFNAALDGLTNILADLKERVGKIENVKLGSESHRTDQRSSIGTMVGLAGVLFGLAMLVMAVMEMTP